MVDRFVSEKELDEAKKRRQEEWEKVRKPTDPEEVPEEKVEKSLYERLKEARDRKQAEYEEAHGLKNMIKKLDMDECDFLKMVDDLKAKQDLEKTKEEMALLKEIDRLEARRNFEENMPSVSNLRVKPTNGLTSKGNKQAAILRTAVKRKSDIEMGKCLGKRSAPSAISSTLRHPSALKIVDVLPGMADYVTSSNSNSDSSINSDSDSSSDLPILPVLIQTPTEKEDKSKQS